MRSLLGKAAGAAAVAALVFGGGLVAPVGAAGGIKAEELPKSMHGAVETQALTVAGSLPPTVPALGGILLDPGTAYAYSTLDRDDYGDGSVNYAMTARGSTNNPGTIAAAVIWAAPNCDEDGNAPCALSGGYGTPNTGLHEAKGFPGYAEALYPPPPKDTGYPSQERVYKCVLSKDGPGSPPTNGGAQDVCKSSDGVPLSAWAETIGEEYRATGFSRVVGFDAPGALKVGNSESHSEVKALDGGKLSSVGSSQINDISILDGQIKVRSVSSTATVIASDGKVFDRSADCRFAGLEVGGQEIKMKGDELPAAQLKPLLDGIEKATHLRVEIDPPTPVVLKTDEGGKEVAACQGMQVKLTDVSQGSPVPVCAPAQPDPTVPACVPPLGSRLELSFGKISVQQSVNKLATGLGAVTDALTGGLAEVGGFPGPADGGGTAAAPSSDGAGTGEIAAPPSAGGGTTQASRNAAPAANQQAATGTVGKLRNAGAIGALTAASAGAIVLCVLLLMGVVDALATGGPFKFPGF